MTWNARNLLSYSKNNATISYSYNADGIRRSKQSANEKIIYDYAGSTLVHEYHETSGIDIFYSYDSKGHLMMIETLQNQVLNKYYVAVNSRGDVEKIYNSSKALVAQYSYDSWGKVISVLDGNGNTPTSSTHIANLNPIRYRGYYYDSESGFYYLQSRYYDPNVQRFVNSDEISVVTSTLDQITDKNLYTYCDNNPIMRYDDEGEFWNTIIEAVVGGITAALSGESVVGGVISGAISGVFDDLGAVYACLFPLNPIGALATIAVFSFVGGYASNLVNQHMNGTKANDLDHGSAFREGLSNSFIAVAGEKIKFEYDLKINTGSDPNNNINDKVVKTINKFLDKTKGIRKTVYENFYSYTNSTLFDGMYTNHYRSLTQY